MSDIFHLTYPVAIIEDRYGGLYSGGHWLAVAKADERIGEHGDQTRIQFVLEDETGPHGSDPDAGDFWDNREPDWIASGHTPDEALENLRAKVLP